MPWIGNYSFADIYNGRHAIEPGRTVLIRIADIGHLFKETDVKLRAEFSAIHLFRFFDIEPEEVHDETQVGEIVPAQAVIIEYILSEALNEGYNVVVHCNAGLCRSGAVAEVGVMMGFDDLRRPRTPNLFVKRLLMNQAGFNWNALFEQRMKEAACWLQCILRINLTAVGMAGWS